MGTVIDLTSKVDFAPASEQEEIIQNVRYIVSTIKGSVPLDRDFGISSKYIDKPMHIAQAIMSSEIIMAVKKYEPRAVISAIEFTGLLDGVLTPKITLQIGGES